MIGGAFRYIRLGTPIPDGWELVADFEGCHHGRYSQGIIRKIETVAECCPFCGKAGYKTHYVHGHVETLCCKQVSSSCCPGAGDGESG